MRLIYISLIIITLTGCSKPEPATFSNYDIYNAGDISLLMTLKCSDYINSSNCQSKQNDSAPLFTQALLRLSGDDESKAECIFHQFQTPAGNKVSEQFYSYVRKKRLANYNTSDAFYMWLKDYKCM